MDLIIVIALIIIFIILWNIQGSLRENASINKKDLTILYRELQEIKNDLARSHDKTASTTNTTIALDAEQQAKEKEAAELKQSEQYREKLAVIEEMRRLKEEKLKAKEQEALQVQSAATVVETGQTTVATKPSLETRSENWQQKWGRKNPDLEKFIGENLINKIGIAILVLAIGFFVKYAIDKDWVGSVGRVNIGILCGAILIALAHKLRNTYKAFSSVLAGGGVAVFYFTISLAFHQFQLFSQQVAFFIMLGITIFSVILSLLYNKQELAIIALLGGFIAPFLVSNGNNNYIALFTYLVILNTGLLVIAYNKAWRILNALSFLFTIIIFGGWFTLLRDCEQVITWRNGFLFATAFYLLYFIINIAHNIKEKKQFIASNFGILLANTSLYFSVGIICLNNMELSASKGLFSAAMGAFNLVASYFLFRKQKVDINILYLLIGITLSFISITAPLQLHGNYITLFWATEGVLLYWLFIKSRIYIIQYSAAIILMAMIISLAMDWFQLYNTYNDHLPVIANKAFITSLFASIATLLLYILRNKEDNETKLARHDLFPGKVVLCIMTIALLFATGAFEIDYQFRFYFKGTYLYVLYLLLYTMAFIATIAFISSATKKLALPWRIVAVILSVCIAFYLLCTPPAFSIQQEIMASFTKISPVHFLAHWLTAILTAVVIYKLIYLLRANKTAMKNSFDGASWVICAVIVIFFSVEFHLMANMIFNSADNSLSDIHRVYIKTALPILWGLCSFTFMWLGMHYKFRTLRIISLTLFAITLVKLFTFDISNIPVGGKIAAFFCLGVLLLVVSFMYQRLKKIIIEDEEKAS